MLKGAKHVLISSEFDPIVKWKSKIAKGIEEYLKCYKEDLHIRKIQSGQADKSDKLFHYSWTKRWKTWSFWSKIQ